MIIGLDVTKCWSISYEIGTQQQRDWCQNFSLGHNFCLMMMMTRRRWRRNLGDEEKEVKDEDDDEVEV